CRAQETRDYSGCSQRKNDGLRQTLFPPTSGKDGCARGLKALCCGAILKLTAMADKIRSSISSFCGAIAQLGERIVRNDEVVGSIPTSSTNLTICKQASSRMFARIAQ